MARVPRTLAVASGAAGPRRRRSPKLPTPPSSLLADCGHDSFGDSAGWSPPPQRSGDGDHAAGPVRHISLSEPGFLPKLCCCVPGIILFALMLTVATAAYFSQPAFYVITAVLTIFTMSYSTNLSLSCAVGAWRMRRDAAKDWHSMLQGLRKQRPEGCEVMHIIILPNYKEEEHMLQHTLDNLGRSPMALETMHVVLAMEEREGPEARVKAERLIEKCSHHFAGIFACFHPAGLPGEIAGKSSNTQWAYREALQRKAGDLAKLDASRVFLTVGDADTLWHPQFFSALAYEALSVSRRERAWTLWQPPVLLMRNLFSCPGPTRVSGYATILFELAGLANQCFSSHFCYSAYTLTLALASHPLVGGWDRDVIAEDHHMFCKCYFASIREQLGACGGRSSSSADGTAATKASTVQPRVQLKPVYLPAISYLVESDGGWFASCRARFQQARRHSQGVAELSYVLLQYARLLKAGGLGCLPPSTHAKVLNIMGKMATVHIVNSVQAFSLLLVGALLLPGLFSWLLAGGVGNVLRSSEGAFPGVASESFGGLKWALCAIFGPIPPIGMLMTATTYIVIRDVLEGRLTCDPEAWGEAAPGAESTGALPHVPDVQGFAPTREGLGWRRKVGLFFMIQYDYFSLAHTTLIAYGLIPITLATWSLLRNGTRFEYITAAKPS